MTAFILFLVSLYCQTVMVGGAKLVGTSSTGVVTSGGGSFTITNVGQSTTQAIFSYTAPSGSACNVEASESATYSPVVNDVNTSLFTNSNLDSRASGISSGTSRIFVLGSRYPSLANDAVTTYSRALQNTTLHYVRVTCGADVGTTTFTTANIPVGSTLNEPPPADPANAGGWVLPTLSGARNQIIIDPQTGSQHSRVSIQADITETNSFGHTIYDGAQGHACNPALHTDGGGAQGYLCNLDSKQGHHDLYFIVPATGESRFLGYNHLGSNADVDDALKVYTGDTTQETPSAGTVTIGAASGTRVFGTGDSSPLFAGLRARATHCTTRSGDCTVLDTANFVEGIISFYGCPAGCHLDIAVDLVGGSGTFSDWAILGVDNTFVYTYTGGFTAVAPGTPVPVSGPALFTGVSGAILINNFDPTFDLARYGSTSCTRPGGAPFTYTPILCGGQDSYGYVASFYNGDGRTIPPSCMIGDAECPRVVADWNTLTDSRFKYCGLHASLPVPGAPLFSINWHGMSTNIMDQGNTTLGTAGWFSTIAADVSAGNSTFTVTGDPASLATGGDSITPVPVPAAGDRLLVNLYNNGIPSLVTKVGNTWTLNNPLAQNITMGQKAQMFCSAPGSTDDGIWSITYFDLSDTSGNGVIFDLPWPGGGHFDIGPLGRVSEAGAGYAFVKTNGAPYIDSLNQPVTIIPSSASWNGVVAPGFGNLLTKHPTYHQLTSGSWFMDNPVFSGGATDSPSGGRYYSALIGATAISGGPLYQYFPDSSFPLHRKLVSTQSTNGKFSLIDVSGIGVTISSSSGDNFKYCVAYHAGDCVSGSSAGNVYFNAPAIDLLYCSGGDAPNPTNLDVCINDMPAYAGGLMQFTMGSDGADSQAKSRNLGSGLTSPKYVYVFPLLKSSSQAEFALWTQGIVINGNPGGINLIDVWKTKLTTLPAPDATNRTGFISTSISVSAGAQNNAIVKFWYQEVKDGGGVSRCGTRAEDCYATAATVPGGANPYFYPSDGASGTLITLTGLACSGGCNIAVPALTGHVLYTAVVRRDASNNILGTDTTQVRIIP